MRGKVDLAEKFASFTEHWTPKIVGEMNGQFVKLAKLKGEFVWHRHQDEDEMFLVTKGRLKIRLRDRDDVELGPGEFFVVPKGVEHSPIADDEVHVVLLEPKSTAHTGNTDSEMTVPTEHQEWI
ncbi:MAG: cupin domain-containing protein [Alphaproteobacteria bacterium]|nr:cupin domain-containing protein [Alphaproteobacteria bacterium]